MRQVRGLISQAYLGSVFVQFETNQVPYFHLVWLPYDSGRTSTKRVLVLAQGHRYRFQMVKQC